MRKPILRYADSSPVFVDRATVSTSVRAIELASRMPEEFPDGVHFVSLAAVRDPALVPVSIAGGIGLQDARGTAGQGERGGQDDLDDPQEHGHPTCALI